MDLFSTIFCGNPVPLQVDKFTRVFQKSPLTMDNPLPPTAPGRQFFVSTAAPPKRVPSLQHCLLSDGGLDVEIYLHVKLPLANGCSGGLMALNLIHGVGESLSAGSKARSLATDFKKIPGTKMCLWTQRFCGFGIAGHETQRIPVVGYVCK